MAARAAGGDVVLRLMHEVTQLRDDVRASAALIDGVQDHLEKVVRGMEQLATHAKSQDHHLGRMAKLLGDLAGTVQDHEDRLRSLERSH